MCEFSGVPKRLSLAGPIRQQVVSPIWQQRYSAVDQSPSEGNRPGAIALWPKSISVAFGSTVPEVRINLSAPSYYAGLGEADNLILHSFIGFDVRNTHEPQL